MTDVEYYRMKKLVPQLRRLAQEYPMHTLETVIRNLDARMEHHNSHKRHKRPSCMLSCHDSHSQRQTP